MNCPNCQNKLSKNLRHGEGVWYCEKCTYVWFIVNIKKDKLRGIGGKSNENRR